MDLLRHGTRNNPIHADDRDGAPVTTRANRLPKRVRAIGLDADQLCQACITGSYPTPCGRVLAQEAVENYRRGVSTRTYDTFGQPQRGDGEGRSEKRVKAVSPGPQSAADPG